MATHSVHTPTLALGTQAIVQAATVAAIAALVDAVRALPTPPTNLRATRSWLEKLIGLDSPAQRWARRWSKACARVDGAADGLHRHRADLEAMVRARSQQAPSQHQTDADGVGALAAPAVARTSASIDAHTQALLERTARILDEVLPFWEKSTGMHGMGGAHQRVVDVRASMLGKLA